MGGAPDIVRARLSRLQVQANAYPSDPVSDLRLLLGMPRYDDRYSVRKGSLYTTYPPLDTRTLAYGMISV